MKAIFCLIVALTAAVFSGIGQTLPARPQLPPLHYGPLTLQSPAPDLAPFQSVETPDRLWLIGGFLDSVRILRPDHMRCRVTDLTRLEHMPVKRTRNADRMPNGAVQQLLP